MCIRDSVNTVVVIVVIADIALAVVVKVGLVGIGGVGAIVIVIGDAIFVDVRRGLCGAWVCARTAVCQGVAIGVDASGCLLADEY